MEVLVHISGPGRVHDDKKYRKQAQGLQTFNGVRKEHVHTSSKRARTLNAGDEEISRSKRQRRVGIVPKERGTKEALNNSPAEDNGPDSQQNQGLSQTTKESTPSFDRGFQKHGHPSSEADLITSSLDSNTYCQLVCARALTHPRTVSAPNLPSLKPGIIQVQRSASDSFETLPSVIPDSQPSQSSVKRAHNVEGTQLEDLDSLTRRKRQRRELSSVARTPHETIPSSVGECDDEQTPRPKFVSQDVQKVRVAGSGKYTVESACTIGAGSSDGCIARTAQTPRDEQAHVSSLQIMHPFAQATSTPPNWQVIHTFRPPEPAASRKAFTTHITDFLHKFIDKELSVARRYKPLSALRPVDPLERGRWEFLLPAEILEAKKRRRFLEEVDAHMKKSKPGWGTWCQILAPAFDPDETVGESTVERREQQKERLEQDWLIRMWCWGEVIGHIYLFLWLLTATEIKGLSAIWIDADGEVIVRME